MTVKISKPALNLREELNKLDKPSGITGETLLRADTDADARATLGIDNFEQVSVSTDGVISADGLTTTSSVGIGTSSPTRNLTVHGGAGNSIFALQNNSTGAAAGDGFQIQLVGNDIYQYNYDNGFMVFGTNNAERMRLSGGNLLVGKTASSFNTSGIELKPDHLQVTRNSTVTYFNRTGSDGIISNFYKDGTTVGSIGTDSGDLTIYGTVAGHTGFRFGNGEVYPTNNAGSLSDNTMSLGSTTVRFKDLYLSGGVYLGGTGAANKLEDYESGTFTPYLYDGTTSVALGTGHYTKIGQLVTIFINAYNYDLSSISATDGLRITNLPFSATSSAPVSFATNTPNGKPLAVHVGGTSTFIWVTEASALDFSYGTKTNIGLGTGNATVRGSFYYNA